MREDDGFREFVVAESPRLSRVAFLLTGDHQLAEDLLQSALANAYRHWSRVREGNPQAYVRKAMHHQQISWWRRRRVKESLSEQLPESGAAPDPTEQTALRVTIMQALMLLTPRQRAVILLRYYDDMTEAETAQVLVCSVGTVKRHTHDALRRLREAAPHLLADLPGGVRL